MKPFSSLVVGNLHRSLCNVRVYQRFHPIGYRIVRVEDIKHGLARGQLKVTVQTFHPSYCQEHGYRRAESEELSNVEVELWVVN